MSVANIIEGFKVGYFAGEEVSVIIGRFHSLLLLE